MTNNSDFFSITLSNIRRKEMRRKIDWDKRLSDVELPKIQPMTDEESLEMQLDQYQRFHGRKPLPVSKGLLTQITLETMAQATRDHAKYLATAGKVISSVCASCGRTCKQSEKMFPSSFSETRMICEECV